MIHTAFHIVNPACNYLAVIVVVQDFMGNVLGIQEQEFELEKDGK